MTKNGRCKAGSYYCYTDKKCKPIPAGFKVDPRGMLAKENGHSVDDESETKKNGNGNGNGNGGNGNGGGMSESKSGDSSLRDWFGKSKSSDGKPGWVQLGGKYAGKPCAKQPGQTTKPKCGSSKMKRNLSKDEEEAAFRRKNRKDPNPDRRGKAINVATEEHKKDYEYSMARSELKTIKNAAKRLEKKMGKKGEGELKAWVQSKITKAADYIDTAADYMTNEAAGEKDACYHKVKSRYKVWPSAYASGALVKCRKKGAANWGNSTKKESVSIEDASGRTYVEFIDLIKPEPLQPTQGIGSELLGEKCWPGYEKKGMKTMFGKRYPNCVKKTKKEEVECMHNLKGEECPVHGKKECPSEVSEAVRIPAKTGNLIFVMFNWRGKYLSLRMFFPNTKMPSRSEVQDQIEKVYPGARVQSFQVSSYEPGQSFLRVSEETEDQGGENIRINGSNGEVSEGQVVDSEGTLEEGAAWTKKEGKSKSGGLNEKGRKSYERENPGSDLKAPSKKVGNPRRKSFCARMKGMKKKLTSAKTARDPDSRINKSLRAWNC
jgi:hypothetical protein